MCSVPGSPLTLSKGSGRAGEYPREPWDRLEAYFTRIERRTTDTAILELGVKEYLYWHDNAAKCKK
jgi:hypothetical protein